MRDTFIFYRSFYEAIKELPPINQAEIFKAICQYSLDKKISELTGISKTVWILIKPILDANNRRFENGSKPKNKRNRSKMEAKPKQDGSETEANKDKDVDKDKDLDIFSKAIENYGGTKRGAKTELAYLQKTQKDWRTVLPLLGAAIKNQSEERRWKKEKAVFVPEWKNLKTWLYNRCWEQQVEIQEKSVPFSEKYNIVLPDMTGGYQEKAQ